MDANARTCAITGCNRQLGRGAKYCSLKCVQFAQKKSRSACLSGCGNMAKLHRTRYCSLSCATAHRYRRRAEAFFARGGIYGYVHPQFLARALRDYYGERCLRCGWSNRHEKTGKVPVEVEHIDGDWQNNRLTNLTLLCPNCHALTPTFRGLNRGRGRAHRLMRYKNRPIPAAAAFPAMQKRPPHLQVFDLPLMQLQLLPPT